MSIPQNGCGPADSRAKGTKIEPPQPKEQARGRPCNGQFGTSVVDAKKEVELCVPSNAIFP